MTEGLPLADELAYVFARAGNLMLAEQTVETALSLLTSIATRAVPGAIGAGLTLTDADGAPLTSAGTDPIVERADAVQYELDEGPCLDAWRRGVVVRSDDLDAEERWPRWVPAARELGLRAMVSAPLATGDRTVGAIKVYATAAGTFTDRDVDALGLFGAQAGVLVAHRAAARRAGSLSGELHTALERRDVTNQAIGLLMGRDGGTAEAALAHLLSLSNRDHRPIHEVAARLVRSGARRAR